jgi:hypothetical protein
MPIPGLNFNAQSNDAFGLSAFAPSSIISAVTCGFDPECRRMLAQGQQQQAALQQQQLQQQAALQQQQSEKQEQQKQFQQRALLAALAFFLIVMLSYIYVTYGSNNAKQ